MNKPLFEQLLYEEESPVLDFKSHQYQFSKATEIEKSELLKDILGFVNAWRRGSDAYILIGVKEVRGGRSEVLGIRPEDHLDDHSLQQFVNNLVNKPIQFRYEAYGYEEKQIGIICINEQHRPIYLKKNYGKLKKETVYVRRGSSTDPNKPASIDEIAQMGLVTPQESAQLQVAFADCDRDVALGTELSYRSEFCKIPSDDVIPDCVRDEPEGHLASMMQTIERRYWNKNFYRELSEYEFLRRLYKPVRLSIKNISPQPAKHVRIEIELQNIAAIHAIKNSDLPRPPRIQQDSLDFITDINPHPAIKFPGYTRITGSNEHSFIEIDCQDIQPGRIIYSEQFLVGIGKSSELKVSGTIYSDSMPKPQQFTLQFNAEVSQTSISVEELCDMDEP